MIVVADPLPAVVLRGETIDLAVHVVSDLREPIGEARVRATVRAGESEATQTWVGPIPADDCVLIGHITTTVPDNATDVEVDLELTGSDLSVTNRYTALAR